MIEPSASGSSTSEPSAPSGFLRSIDTRMRGWRLVAVLALGAALSGVIAARITGIDGPWLWNYDSPLDIPLASFFHDALSHTSLPFWNDQMGQGFPLYAEGKISLFYLPHWLIYQLPPLQAVDLTLVLHLAWLGLGTGLVVLRLSGSRTAALLAALAMPLSGGVVTKLEWVNMTEAFSWLPWVLLPLLRTPFPTRRGIALAGIAWGVQAILGLPNIWILTGLTAAIILIAHSRTIGSVGRVVTFGLIGAGVGAIQLIPTLILLGLSVRSGGVGAFDLFSYSATPFDWLSAAFANFFTPAADPWNLNGSWQPDLTFGVLEGGIYVGLPILALAAVGIWTRRGRVLLPLILVMLAIPIVVAFRPGAWLSTPILDALRRWTRTYMFVDFALIVAAGLGLARLGRGAWPGSVRERWHWARRRAAAAVAAPIAGYVVMLLLVTVFAGTFEALMAGRWNLAPGAEVAFTAVAANTLQRPYPVLLEVGLGLVALFLVWRWRRSTLVLVVAIAISVGPLALLMPTVNPLEPSDYFLDTNSPIATVLQPLGPNRVLTIGGSRVFDVYPNQLAAAGIPDLTYHSSLNLAATDQLVATMQAHPDDMTLERILGVDIVVTYGSPCPGDHVATAGDGGSVCRLDPPAISVPYWLPASSVLVGAAPAIPFIQPTVAVFDPEAAPSVAQPVDIAAGDSTSDQIGFDAPTAGYVFVDRSWWPMWQTTVDGRNVPTYEAFGGQLIPVPAGRHVIEQRLVLVDAGVGLAIGIATLVAAWFWVGAGRQRRPEPTREVVGAMTSDSAPPSPEPPAPPAPDPPATISS